MSKVISAGILVQVHSDGYVLGHVTNCTHWDIFKGRQDEGETLVQTAIRECQEESGLIFQESDLKFLGKFDYTKKKDIAIYITKLDGLDISTLKCTSLLENSDPELDYYAEFSFDTMLSSVGSAMNKVLSSLESEIKEHYAATT
jgi:8-oxo-dGTP pyrophosphatase MutT (NUDIX family)